MKKLICAKDMEEFISEGKTKFYVASDMIITPVSYTHLDVYKRQVQKRVNQMM